MAIETMSAAARPRMCRVIGRPLRVSRTWIVYRTDDAASVFDTAAVSPGFDTACPPPATAKVAATEAATATPPSTTSFRIGGERRAPRGGYGYSGMSQTAPSGGSVSVAENGWSWHGTGSASTPPRVPTPDPP